MLDLDRIAAKDPQRVKYIPCKIRSAKVITGVGKIAHKLWESGSITVTGAKSDLDTIASMNKNIEFYRQFVVPTLGKRKRREEFTLELEDIVDMDEFIDEITI
jgi:TATA-box binding protein (TBP) (component of TFIID and TFIIIB)